MLSYVHFITHTYITDVNMLAKSDYKLEGLVFTYELVLLLIMTYEIH